MKDKLIQYLQQFVTERRLKLFDSRLENRTRYLTVVLEDIFQSHNASAVSAFLRMLRGTGRAYH